MHHATLITQLQKVGLKINVARKVRLKKSCNKKHVQAVDGGSRADSQQLHARLGHHYVPQGAAAVLVLSVARKKVEKMLATNDFSGAPPLTTRKPSILARQS